MARMSDIQRARHARLIECKDSARRAVYASADSDLPFAACLRTVEPEIRDAYHAADSALATFESRMIRIRCATRTGSGIFLPN